MKTLLNAATALVTGAGVNPASANRAFQATVVGTGAVSATVVIEGSNDGTNYLALGTITLSGANLASDGFLSNANWAMVRARMPSNPTGTGAAVTVTMGE